MSPANLWSRVVALLVDTVPMIALIALSGGVIGLATGNPNRPDGFGERLTHFTIQSFLIVIGALAYFGILHWSKGQTLGKMFARTRVVSTEGKTPQLSICLWRAFWQAAILPACNVAGSLILLIPYINDPPFRHILIPTILASVLFLFGLLAIIIDISSMFFNSYHRMLHDYLSGTFVVSLRHDDAVESHSQIDASRNLS